MAFENFPPSESAPYTPPREPKKDWRTLLSIPLIIALLGTWGYSIWDKSKTKDEIQKKDSQYSVVIWPSEQGTMRLNLPPHRL